MSSNSISQHERHGAWVPASAGTTLLAHSSSLRTRALGESQHLLTFAGVRFGAFRSVGYGYDQFGNRVAVRSGGKSAEPDRRHYPEIERRCRKIRGFDLVGCCRAKPVLAGQRW